MAGVGRGAGKLSVVILRVNLIFISLQLYFYGVKVHVCTTVIYQSRQRLLQCMNKTFTVFFYAMSLCYPIYVCGKEADDVLIANLLMIRNLFLS